MKLSRHLGIVLLLACACATGQTKQERAAAEAEAAAAKTVEPPLPMDPDVRTGTLDNGLTFYIRKNAKPEQRASMWLAVNAGSVLEDDDQRGLAHFVEHMAFNGTARFEKNTLIDFIEKAGMDFGADLNAFTSFDETVYMLTVPTDDAEAMKTGMDILEDWAGALSFDPVEVDKERGVVIEEWRLGRGASQRAFDKQWPIYLKDSKYADRKPIGEKEILQSAPVEALTRFYKDWYRPDLMAVIVVGDVDPAVMEGEIRSRFSDLKGPDNPRPRENVPVPLLSERRAAVVTDPETSMPQVTLSIKGPYSPVHTESDARADLVERLFHGMLRARLDEIRLKPDAPFAFAFSGTSDMGRAVDTFQLVGFVKPDKIKETVETFATEVERVRRHGFLASELERQKAETLRDFERAVKEKDKAESRGYAFELAFHFLEGEAAPGRDAELGLAKKYVPGITLDEVNKLAETWTSRKDQVVMASLPARDKAPSEAELLAALDAARAADVKPYTEALMAESLMAQAPKAGTIVKEERVEPIDVTIWTLSNGARVIVKPTDFKNDEIRMQAFSPGGHSLAKNENYRSASSAGGVVAEAGLGEFDEPTIQKMMAGKVAGVRPWINELEEGLWGSASPDDVEDMMQMVHLAFTAPRKDAAAFGAWKGTQATFVKNRDLNPQRVFFDKLGVFFNSDHPRRQPMTVELLEEVKLDAAFDFYKDRFADAGDFTFVFVGNVDLAKLKELSATYLASLPTTGRKEKWKDVGVKHPRGVKKLDVTKGQDPKSFVMIRYHGPAKWSAEAEDDLEMLSEVLDIRLREVLREEMGGVYGAFSFGDLARRPKQEYEYTIGFGCAPENVDKLKQAVFDIIATVKKEGVGDVYLEKVRQQRKRSLETDLKENSFWAGQLAKHYRYGTDPSKIVEDANKNVARVSSETVQKAAKKYLGKSYVEAVLMPDASAADSGAPAGDKPKQPKPAPKQ